MKLPRALCIASLASLLSFQSFAADDYQPGPDSLPQPGVPKGEMLKDKYIAKEGSVFPGTEREYQIYLPVGLDNSKPAPFMVFQDGVIYQAPVVFDNLIAKKEIPPLIGIFIKPGVVPAANDNALPRFNRSYEYDSVTDTYSRFLTDEFLPAIAAKHKLNLSTDPNARGIAGSSSGGICAFMVAWHRPDSFRRVFTSVGTYVGIHGADQLPVLVRKYEPKPIRIHLQSGEADNNLYCGDWWMANQMMERSLTWNGYDVNHTWGTGGHNQKHATAIFPDVLRWLWKGYPHEPVKANPRGDAKWRGGEVIGDGEWEQIKISEENTGTLSDDEKKDVLRMSATSLAAATNGDVYFFKSRNACIFVITAGQQARLLAGRLRVEFIHKLVVDNVGLVNVLYSRPPEGALALGVLQKDGRLEKKHDHLPGKTFAIDHRHRFFIPSAAENSWTGEEGRASILVLKREEQRGDIFVTGKGDLSSVHNLCFSPDQTQLYGADNTGKRVWTIRVQRNSIVTEAQDPFTNTTDRWDTFVSNGQPYYQLESPADIPSEAGGLCVDTNGWLYVATSLGIQVLDQAGRVNFIIPTPKPPHDVCFGGKDLSELFIACGDTIYKRKTKAHGYISGQMAPIKPAPPKL